MLKKPPKVFCWLIPAGFWIRRCERLWTGSEGCVSTHSLSIILCFCPQVVFRWKGHFPSTPSTCSGLTTLFLCLWMEFAPFRPSPSEWTEFVNNGFSAWFSHNFPPLGRAWNQQSSPSWMLIGSLSSVPLLTHLFHLNLCAWAGLASSVSVQTLQHFMKIAVNNSFSSS